MNFLPPSPDTLPTLFQLFHDFIDGKPLWKPFFFSPSSSSSSDFLIYRQKDLSIPASSCRFKVANFLAILALALPLPLKFPARARPPLSSSPSSFFSFFFLSLPASAIPVFIVSLNTSRLIPYFPFSLRNRSLEAITRIAISSPSHTRWGMLRWKDTGLGKRDIFARPPRRHPWKIYTRPISK